MCRDGGSPPGSAARGGPCYVLPFREAFVDGDGWHCGGRAKIQVDAVRVPSLPEFAMISRTAGRIRPGLPGELQLTATQHRQPSAQPTPPATASPRSGPSTPSATSGSTKAAPPPSAPHRAATKTAGTHSSPSDNTHHTDLKVPGRDTPPRRAAPCTEVVEGRPVRSGCRGEGYDRGFHCVLWVGGAVQTGGVGVAADREWVIQNAKGKKFVYDSAAEAFEELHEYGEGAVVLTRLVYRGFFRTKPVEDWQPVERPAA